MKMNHGNSHRPSGFQPTGFQPTRAGRPNLSEENKQFFAECGRYGLLHQDMGVLQALITCAAINRQIAAAGFYGQDLTDTQRMEVRARVIENHREVRRAVRVLEFADGADG